jgi:polyhydroxyalkanoate synthesis regulator phasin
MNRREVLRIGIAAGLATSAAVIGLAPASPAIAAGRAHHGGPVWFGTFGWKGGGAFRAGAPLATIAQALNMPVGDLQAELLAGKSVAEVAAAKGVSLDAIVNAVVAEQKQLLDQAVAAGRLTQAQADTLLANLKATLPGQLQVKYVPGFGKFGRFDYKLPMMDTIAQALGLTVAELRTELSTGKSVADVAKAKGVDLDKVINAVMEQQTRLVNAAVAAGRLTQAQADAWLNNLRENLPALLSLKGGFGFGRGWPGKWWLPQFNNNVSPTTM